MMRSHALSGVLYAEDFDAPEPVVTALTEAPPVQAEPVIIEPTFSLIDLQRASERARQEERALTRQQGERDAAALQTQALVQLADALSQARAEAARVASEAAEATAQTLLAMIAAVLPAFATSHGHAEAAALLHLILPAMINEPRLTVRAHPSLIRGLQHETAAVLEAGPITVEWIGSHTMSPGDVTVRWQDGLMVRDTNTLCAQVRALIMPEARQPSQIQENVDAH